MIQVIINGLLSVWVALIMTFSGRTVSAQSNQIVLIQQHLQAGEHDYYELLGSRGLRGGPPMEHVYQVLQQHLQEIIPVGSPGASQVKCHGCKPPDSSTSAPSNRGFCSNARR